MSKIDLRAKNWKGGGLAAALLSAILGCASPAADYVRAEKAAWDVYDPYLSGWVDQDPRFDLDTKAAFHALDVGRKARVAHAIAAVGS